MPGPISNLIPFKPGQSGNPAGAKKGTKHFKTILRKMLEMEIDAEVDGVKVRRKASEVLIMNLVDMALKEKKQWAIQEIMNRVDGLPTQEVETTHKVTRINWQKPDYIDDALIDDFRGRAINSAAGGDESNPGEPQSLLPQVPDDH